MVATMKGKGKGDRTTAKKGGKSRGKEEPNSYSAAAGNVELAPKAILVRTTHAMSAPNGRGSATPMVLHPLVTKELKIKPLPNGRPAAPLGRPGKSTRSELKLNLCLTTTTLRTRTTMSTTNPTRKKKVANTTCLHSPSPSPK